MRNTIATGLILFAGFFCGALFRMNGGLLSAVGQSPSAPTSRELGGNNTNQPSALEIAQLIQIPNGNPAGGGPAQGLRFPDGFIAMTSEEAINVSVYDQANRSVVNIATRSIRPEAFMMASEIEGNGSGSVFDHQGHILTNYHVIEGAKDINVTLFNGDSFPAELVGQDPDNDIAVLKIAAPESVLFPVVWGIRAIYE